jgi:hypothetical protein
VLNFTNFCFFLFWGEKKLRQMFDIIKLKKKNPWLNLDFFYVKDLESYFLFNFLFWVFFIGSNLLFGGRRNKMFASSIWVVLFFILLLFY